ncbi:hypothetical protein CEXT_741361 [Caerostris extrusa]|uniref:Uncharacterized protein n=1 Tax=Caerostris extrusa TaxID=172846 RepID=A0AAV4M8Y5_CAEEX|nr:hypothetical protein CEXT_741361 [Caerostris extrusa]
MVMRVCKHCGNNAASVLRVVTYGMRPIHQEPVWAPRIHTQQMSKSRSPLVKLKLTEHPSEKRELGIRDIGSCFSGIKNSSMILYFNKVEVLYHRALKGINKSSVNILQRSIDLLAST